MTKLEQFRTQIGGELGLWLIPCAGLDMVDFFDRYLR
jgi:hypothetical protein